MQTYEAGIVCREPVANGFSCDTHDTVTFSHFGQITHDSASNAVNDPTVILKRCWKCFAQNWRVTSATPIVYQAESTAVRM